MAQGSQIFTVLVLGDNPQELMEQYDMNKEVEKHLKYKYLDAKKLQANSIKIFEKIVATPKEFNFTDFQIDALKDRLKALKDMTPFEYYSNLTEDMYHDENGDAWSNENPNGQWQTAKIGDFFSLPLILKDGTTTHQAKAKDVDWAKMHMQNTAVYEIIWAMIKEGRKPITEKEQTLYEAMRDKENYFNKFKNVDEYVVHNCAYWNYAYLDEDGWKDLDNSGVKDIEWVATYFEKFIEKLQDKDMLVTVYECTKKKD